MSQVALKEKLSQKCDEVFSKYTKENDSYSISLQYLASIFQQLANNENALDVKQALELIGKVCSCMLDLNSKDIFKPYMTLNNQRSFIPSDLTESDFNHLIEILNCVNQPILKARIADILWSYSKSKNIQYARMAIENYIFNDFALFSIENYTFWHRATYLAKSTKQRDYLDRIKNVLLQEIDNPTSDWEFHKFQVAEIFLKTELDKDIFENLAEKMLSESKKFSAKSDDFKKAEDYLSIAKKLFDKANNKDKKIECIYLLAQATEQHGDFKSLSNMVANHFYKLAFQIYRTIRTSHREIYNVEHNLISVQNKITQSGNKIIDEMELLKTQKIDISLLQIQSINHVKNKNSLFESIYYFSGVHSFNYQSILDEAKNQINNSIFSHIAPFTAISQDGRAIDKIESLSLDGNNQDKVIFKTAIKNFGTIRVQLAVLGCILPALNQIQEEFVIPKDFLIELCHYSPVVPEKRENLVATALYYGFEGDFPTCIHLLAPQVENMVRQLFKKQGITTTHTDKENIEHEIGLSALLEKPEAKEILGDDLWFELQAVFTSSLSANLRNMVGHGLLDDETSNSYYSIYGWWFILKWIIRSIGERQ